MSKRFDFSGRFFSILTTVRIYINIYLFGYFVLLYCWIKGIQLGKNIKFNGCPIIKRATNSRISLGDNCRFNSSRNSVALVLTRRCRFISTMENAEIVVGNNVGASGVTIAAANKITIKDNVMIGAYTTIIDNDFHNIDPEKREKYDFTGRPVIIEENVFLGMNCLILKGVKIGRNSVIAANSVVMSDIPPDSIAMGNPCKLVMKRNWNAGRE